MNLAIDSLQRGQWFKLICGASFHHLPSIHTLALIYTLAGANCIDLAADPAILEAARSGIAAALDLQPDCGVPLLMVSFNDGEDPHFRKAQITTACPRECPQPCVAVCPPHAIVPSASQGSIQIQADLCYGCGRCLPVCPSQLISTWSYQRGAADPMPQLWQKGTRAVEIHTQVGRLQAFSQLWQSLQEWIPQLTLVSVSLGDGAGLYAYMRDLIQVMEPAPRHLIWQLDGRPMSGDIGVGTTKATLRLAEKVSQWHLPGTLQLAGGTNQATVAQIRADLPVGGVAYGSYARQLVASVLSDHRETVAVSERSYGSQELAEAVERARQLVDQVRSRSGVAVAPQPRAGSGGVSLDWSYRHRSPGVDPMP